MVFDVSSLEPKIRKILQAPGTDLSTISAKRVRKQLLDLDPTLTPEFVKERKEDIDVVIATIYEQVSTAAPGSGEGRSNSGAKHRREEEEATEEGDEGTEEGPATPPPKKVKKARKADLESRDAELARQLSNELNGRSRSARGGSAKVTKGKANAAKRGKKRVQKSATTVNSDGDEDEGDDSDEVVKPKKRGGGFTKEYALSEPLAALLGVEKLSRPQVVKQLWDHIKANDLQNPSNRREIICDTGFRAIFNVEKIDMFKMNKELGRHLHEP
ncbi:Upstream activation factor subunit spp27 [Grifola frondosa]|uniref:Upstream activation factor subunit spp27 n=1 Tax=Grifola frondosa TaxID=5627 RepID=A0A1C7LYD2_GRIFR|nr:Upstream activation factor subunit spp27 [Grifola frondosa]